MKSLLKVMLILAAIFASTFILGRVFGILTEDNVRAWLTQASEISPLWIAALVVGLLFIDLVVAVPTLTIAILAGYFLGFEAGLLASFLGVACAAIGGYTICWHYGEGLISRIVKDPDERSDLKAAFHRDGPVMILLSRAAPILPEVTACMAGATHMRPGLYALLFAASTLPYLGIATYAGSISSIDNPMPAIYAALVLYGVMWTGWAWFRRRKKLGAATVD